MAPHISMCHKQQFCCWDIAYIKLFDKIDWIYGKTYYLTLCTSISHVDSTQVDRYLLGTEKYLI